MSKVFTDGEKRLLDVEEYERHKRKMKYSDDLDYILKEHVKILVDWINNGRGPFLGGLCQHLVQTLHRTKESVKLSNQGESSGFYLKTQPRSWVNCYISNLVTVNLMWE